MSRSTFLLTLTALFMALVLLLGMTPLGLIPLGFINVTILCVPVITGTIILGLKRGIILGVCFGAVSLLSVLGLTLTAPSALAAALLARSPVLCVIMCFVPRICVPVVTHVVFKLTSKGDERSVKALPIAAAVGSVTNTILYLGLMLLFYFITGLDSAKILALIFGTGIIAGGLEAVAAAIIVTPITIALWKTKKLRIQEKAQ